MENRIKQVAENGPLLLSWRVNLVLDLVLSSILFFFIHEILSFTFVDHNVLNISVTWKPKTKLIPIEPVRVPREFDVSKSNWGVRTYPNYYYPNKRFEVILIVKKPHLALILLRIVNFFNYRLFLFEGTLSLKHHQMFTL